jgi:hypothetical protein
VNQLNGIGDDGEGGKFVTLLGKRGANDFHLATAEGELLGRFQLNGVNGGGYPEFENALKAWQRLPEAARKPKLLTIKRVSPPPGSVIKPPPGGLVLRVYTRNLKRDRKGQLARITKEDVKDRKAYPSVEWTWGNAIYTEPMPDVMWLTEAEWKSLVPSSPRKGDTHLVPDPIQKRIFRYHLINGTFGLPHWWKLEHVRSGSLTLTVEEVTPSLLLRLDGKVLLATDANLARADHGFDARLSGDLVYDPKKTSFTRFNVVAFGDCWGGDWEGGRFARPDRAPLGVAFELARGTSPAEDIPPKGVNFKDLTRGYFAADRP